MFPSSTMTIVRGDVHSSCARKGGANPSQGNVGKQEGVDCATCLTLLNARRGGAIKTTSLKTGETINGKAIFVWDWELFCTNSMLDVALNAEASNAYGVIIGNSRDMTMTASGGVAQGTNGARANVNASIPMFNVAKTDADSILVSLESVVGSGGVKYTSCEAVLPGIAAGSATVSSSSRYANGNAKLPPTQIRLEVQKKDDTKENDLRGRRSMAARKEVMVKQKMTSKDVSSFLHHERKFSHASSFSAPPGPFNAHLFSTDKLQERNRRLESDPSEEPQSQKGEGGNHVTLEVGQTLFEPATHPGFLDGKPMVVGKLVSQCGPNVSLSLSLSLSLTRRGSPSLSLSFPLSPSLPLSYCGFRLSFSLSLTLSLSHSHSLSLSLCLSLSLSLSLMPNIGQGESATARSRRLRKEREA